MTSEEIENGMKLLDEKANELLGVEDWRLLIDKDKLDMAWCSTCILGQLFGDYFEGLMELGIIESEYRDAQANEEAKQLGFILGYGSSDSDWKKLEQGWKQALSKEKD